MSRPIADTELRATLRGIGSEQHENLSVAHFFLYRETSNQLLKSYEQK